MDFWNRFVGRCTSERWGLSGKLAAHCAAQGLVVPMPEHSQLIEGGRQAMLTGHSEADLMQLADWIAGKGMAWHKAGVWRYVSRNFVSELSKALCWDGVSPIEQQWPSARAPPPSAERQEDDTIDRYMNRGNE